MGTSWTDFLPGNTLVKGAKKYFFDQPANQQKAALDQAGQQTTQDTQNLVNFYMGQQAKAQGYYKPLQQMFNTSYGTGGIQAPVLPRKPLNSMYGGG
jgi:hypothetical protein